MTYSSATGSTRRAHPQMVVLTLVTLAVTACDRPPPRPPVVPPEVVHRVAASVTGSWHGTLDVDGSTFTLTFSPGGTVTATVFGVSGTGSWRVTGASSITFTLAGSLPGNGSTLALVRTAATATKDA
jgi:hypothetical protein